MNNLTASFLLALVALMTARGLAAPINGYNSSPDNSAVPSNSTDVILNNSTATNVPAAVSTNIAVLQSKAAREITSVFQEIGELEKYYVR